MDIKQSSLSRYKSNKPQTSRTASEVSKTSSSSRVKDSSDSTAQMMKQLGLKEGQIVKGQIIDHRFHEVRIQLNPGNQVITAKLSTDVPLSIGQEASFQVAEGSSDQLVLKYLPNEASSAIDSMIQKALSASGLSNTDKNRAIVMELLNHGMPVDKQTLQSLIKVSYMNREASPLTLVLMFKNNIPMTPENIRQFEAYQNGSHQLLNNIREITDSIARLFTQQESSASNGILSGEPSNIIQSTVTEQSTFPVNSNSSVASLSNDIGLEATKSNNLLSENLGNIVNNQEMSLNLTDINQSTVLGAGALPSDLNNPFNQLLQINDKLIKIIFNTADNTTSNPLINLTDQLESATLPAPSENPGTLTVNSAMQDSPELLSNFMNSKEQTALLDLIGNYQGSDEIKSQIENKTATFKDVLTFIQAELPGLSDEAAKKLLQSPEYTKLLENAFLQRWTITPQKLAKKDPITALYKNLREDMEQISHIIKLSTSTVEELQLQEPVKKFQENLQFMKYLNEAFTYLQLPVQLRNKQLHSDLYVFTRKKALKEKSDHISVLLHLTMDNLGPLNVHISLNQKMIQAKFYMADFAAEQIVATNMSSLSEALLKKGYTLHSEVVNSFQKPDFSKDFIEEHTMDNDVRRYTFDIRT